MCWRKAVHFAVASSSFIGRYSDHALVLADIENEWINMRIDWGSSDYRVDWSAH